ncbi:MAG: amino acid permease [Gemmataceae bacterium]
MSDNFAQPRQFGYWTAHFVVLASMIGAGILSTSGFTLQATGNPAALLALWVLGGFMALAGAVTVAEMATILPHAGGDYVFVREGFGRGAGVIAGWATFVVGFAGPTAVVAHIALTYLTAPFSDRLIAFLPKWAADSVIPLGATLLIGFVTLTHCVGHRESGRFQVIITSFKILLLVCLGVGGIAFGNGNWHHLTPISWPTAAHWPALATGLIYVSYAYSGWNGAAYLAGEIRDPNRILPKALIGGTLTVIALYLMVNLAYVYALDPVAMSNRSPGEVEKVAELAVFELFGARVANVFSTLVGLSLIASVSAYVLTGPRVSYAMARDGFFPSFAGRLHPTRGIPVYATLAQGGVAITLVWSGSFLQLLDYTSVGLAAVSGLVVASVFPLRRRAVPGSYCMPLYPFPPLIYLGLVVWTVTQQVIDVDKRTPALLSLATILAGVPVAGFLTKRNGKRSV